MFGLDVNNQGLLNDFVVVINTGTFPPTGLTTDAGVQIQTDSGTPITTSG